MVDAEGAALTIWVAKANVHGNQVFEDMLQAIPVLPNCGDGRPRYRLGQFHANTEADYLESQDSCRMRGIKRRSAHRDLESKK